MSALAIENWTDDVEDQQEEWKPTVQTLPNGTVVVHKDSWKPEKDEIVEIAMSQPHASIAHACVALSCTKPTFHLWLKRHPSFKRAFENGKMIGEMLFREKMADHAYEPASQVNNGLIKLLAKNIYGIDEDQPQVVIHNNNNQQTIINNQDESAALYQQALDEVDADE